MNASDDTTPTGARTGTSGTARPHRADQRGHLTVVPAPAPAPGQPSPAAGHDATTGTGPAIPPAVAPAGGHDTSTGGAAGSAATPGRRRLRIGSDPDTIRVLTAELDAGLIPDTYVTAGSPVYVEAVTGTGGPAAGDEDAPLPLTATPLRPSLLAALLADHAEITRLRTDPKGNERVEEVTPSREVLAAVLSKRTWFGLPPLHRIISTPVLRADGTLLQTPGYDPSTGLLLASNRHLDPVPDPPSAEQVHAAREFLLGQFLRDFPWRSPADKANYLGLLVTPILRPYTRALAPFAMVEATMPGSGKSILTGCVGLLVGQRVLGWTDSNEELRKQITTVLADPVGVVVWDNVEEGTVINSAVLARLVTERTWTDRKLGSNTAASFPNDRLWLATGNALRIGGDMASRTVWVRLDPDDPHPEERTGFAIEHLDEWITDPDNQATVLWHLLVLVLDWTAAGAPAARTVPAMRQFTRWAQQIGGFLAHHRVTGFLSNLDDGREQDLESEEWRTFLMQWHHLHGAGADHALTAHELWTSAEIDHWQGTFPAIPRRAGDNPVMSLGRRLAGRTDRWHGDIRLRSVKDEGHRNKRVFWVEHRNTTTTADRPSEPSPQVRKSADIPLDQDKPW